MNKKTGFTLIELLVVIFIIALLASIIVVNVNYTRKKARDAERIADLTKVAAALENYFLDKGYYPPPFPENTSLPIYPGSKNTYVTIANLLRSNGYLENCPQDPLLRNYTSDPCLAPLPVNITDDDRTDYVSWGYRYTCWDDIADGGLHDLINTGPCKTYKLAGPVEIDANASLVTGTNSGLPEKIFCNGRFTNSNSCSIFFDRTVGF